MACRQRVLGVGQRVGAALQVAHRVRALGHRGVEHEHADEATEQQRDAQGEEQAVALHLRRRHDLELARGRRGAAGAGARQRPDRGELAHAVAPFGSETFGGAQAGRGGSGVGVLLLLVGHLGATGEQAQVGGVLGQLDRQPVRGAAVGAGRRRPAW